MTIESENHSGGQFSAILVFRRSGDPMFWLSAPLDLQ